MVLDYIALGKNIRKHRLLAKMTQLELSDRVDCTDTHIGQVEHGRSVPSLAITVAIANALDVGIDQLIYSDLRNRGDYFTQELSSLIEGLESRDKRMAIELVKSLVGALKDFKEK